MNQKRICLFAVLLACATLAAGILGQAAAWSNGGYSENPIQPSYGTHDWIAEHALDFLPPEERQFYASDRADYLYGTELPDNGMEPGGVGDTTNHHVYFRADGSLQDDASAVRAGEEYANAKASLNTGNILATMQHLGMMTHYVADLAVFGHLMGNSTAWGAEQHHSDYENYVLTRTDSYGEVGFEGYLAFDGSLTNQSAYDAAIAVAFDTTFGGASGLNCTWMDGHYNWGDAAFKDRVGQSLNLAVNAVAEVMHTFYLENLAPTPTATPSPQPSPTATIPEFPTGLMVAAIVMAVSAFAILKNEHSFAQHSL